MKGKLTLLLGLVLAGSGQAQLFPPDPLETWTPRSSGSSNHLRGVAYGKGLLVAVGDAGTVLTSTNGVVWTSQNSGSFNSLYGVAWGNGRFVAVGEDGTILTSTDGLSWTARDSGLRVPLLGVDGTSGLFVAVGGSNSLSSVDGINWTPGDLGPDAYANAVAYGNNLFVAVGGASPGFHQLVSSLSTSSDGFTWTRQFSGSPESLAGLSYGAGRFVAVGATGDPHCCDHALIRVFENTMTWSDPSVPTDAGNPDLHGVSYGNRTFVVVGDCGKIANSSDGAIWYNRRSPGSCDPFLSLNAVTFGFGTFVTVGTGGAILQSGPIASLSLRIKGFAELTLSGSAGSYRIESSDHLEDANGWQTLSTLVVSDAPYIYFDKSSTNASQRFYRAVRE